MKIHEPIGNLLYGPLLIRLVIGSYFIMAGLKKIEDLEAFIKVIQEFKILPQQLAVLYGIVVPYLEIGAGALLILGFWTTLAGLVCSLLLCSYIIAIGFFPFGSKELFNKDIIILASTVSLLFTGAGALSIDRFRKNG